MDVVRAMAAAGGRYGSMLLFLLLWVAVGALFVMVAFRDRRRPPSQPGAPVPRLPAPRHPLRQVHTALVSARQTLRRTAAKEQEAAAERAEREAAEKEAERGAAEKDAPRPARPSGGTDPPGDAARPPGKANAPPGRRKPRRGSHLRKVE